MLTDVKSANITFFLILFGDLFQPTTIFSIGSDHVGKRKNLGIDKHITYYKISLSQI